MKRFGQWFETITRGGVSRMGEEIKVADVTGSNVGVDDTVAIDGEQLWREKAEAGDPEAIEVLARIEAKRQRREQARQDEESGYAREIKLDELGLSPDGTDKK
ncbi:MAG: hypothetical protein WA057_00970 [Candidatus Magasanikiibacteriota bacterium]